jgi:G3E family GTPase
MAEYSELTPVNIITGFLGSGKTTLLQRLLRSPDLADVAVLVNEFGEVGLDHHLLQGVAESTVLLGNGCLCCAVRGDLQRALRDLLSRRTRGEVPNFRRVVIETSGLADPAPIAYTLLSEAVLRHHFRLSGIVTTVDAVNGADQLERFPESARQIAMADRLVITKADLADEEAVAALRQRLRRRNVAAQVLDAQEAGGDIARLLTDDIYDTAGKSRTARHWIAEEVDERATHTADVQSFVVIFSEPLDWTAFGVWASMLLHRHGADILRLKGLLNVAGVPTPVLINGVQHIVHPPSHLDEWPDSDRRSRLVFIVRGLQRERIEHSLAVFNGLVDNPSANVGRREGGGATDAPGYRPTPSAHPLARG